MSEGHTQGPYVAARAGFEPATLRMNGVESTNEPPCPANKCNVMRLLIFWSSLSWLRPALVADLSARPPRGTFWCHVLALPPDRKGLSRLWVPLLGMIFPLNFVLCRVTFPVLFINFPRLSSLAEPGLGAPMSSYIEVALCKLIYRYIDRIDAFDMVDHEILLQRLQLSCGISNSTPLWFKSYVSYHSQMVIFGDSRSKWARVRL